MKQMVLAFVAIMIFSVSAMAQENGTGKKERKPMDKSEMVKMRTERMVKTYGLNEAQAKQLLEVNTKYADKMRPQRFRQPDGKRPQSIRRKDDIVKKDSLRQEKNITNGRDKGFQEMKKNREAYESELKAIMTEEQFKAYSDDAAKREKQMREGHKRQRR